MRIEFGFSILDSATGKLGLFTGRMAMSAEGYLLPEIVDRAPDEGAAFAECYALPKVSDAARVSGMLITFGPPGLAISLVEIHRAEVAA